MALSCNGDIDFIPLVKAYPALSTKYGEVSCAAGVEMTTHGPRWIRLYPVPFRPLDDDQQFRKYQPVCLSVEAHRGDLVGAGWKLGRLRRLKTRPLGVAVGCPAGS